MATDSVTGAGLAGANSLPDLNDRPIKRNADFRADLQQSPATLLASNDQYFDGGEVFADTGARTLVAQDEANSRMNVDATAADSLREGTLVAGRPALAETVPNITVSPNTYQGKELRYNAGVKPGEQVAGYSQQDSRWGSLDYTWAPGKPKFDWGGRVKTWEGATTGTWGDANGKGGIGCTATAFTNGLRAVNPQSGVTPLNAAKLDNKFWGAVNSTNFRDLSGQGRQVTNRAFENTFVAKPNGKQWGPGIEQMNPPVNIQSGDGQKMVNDVRQSLQNGKPVLLGFRNETPDKDGNRAIRHSSLAVGYANGQLQILDSETGKVGSMDQFLSNYGYNRPQFDYAYEMSRK